ncbi:MAG: hypothetical protein M3Y07_12780, partial [Acidobacteriota bacterium]|nr:hypothetical protein [Acidobacteriota bacterium]
MFVMKQWRKSLWPSFRYTRKPPSRDQLVVVVGEVHGPKEREPPEMPQWLAFPERGLCTGIVVFGAIDSGKTSCCMYPFAEQILGYAAHDPNWP